MVRIKKLRFIYLSFITGALTLLFLSSFEDIGYSFTMVQTINLSAYEEIRCYFDKGSYDQLPLLDEKSVKKNSSIFFFETSCRDYIFPLNPRQACAIESAAYLNPSADIYLLVPSPIRMLESKPYIKQMLSYSNVKLRHIDMDSFFVNTPLQTLYENGALKTSKWPASHASDLLRYTALWKFGGTYLDLDIVLLKPFGNLTNFVGVESLDSVAAGFLSMTYQHELADLAMLELKENFDGNTWGANGPRIITRVLQKYCQAIFAFEMNEEKCKGFKVFKPSVLYPVQWRDWQYYFTANAKHIVMLMNEFKDSLAIHVWNRETKDVPVIVNSNQPYSIIASKFCPKVYSRLADTF